MDKMKRIGLVVMSTLLLSSVFGIGMSSAAIDITAADIGINETGLGSANASICVDNNSRLYGFWLEGNVTNETVVTLGKDGRFIELGSSRRLVVDISPKWNQTIEIYAKGNSSFEVWGMITASVVWRNNQWEIDNPEQEDEKVLLGTVHVLEGMGREERP